MFRQGYFDGNKPLSFTNLDHLQQQAKLLHKQEIIDAVGVGSQFDRNYLYGYHDKAEQYYQEAFGSKGSNEHICTYEKCPQCLKVQLPQQEISDEEIDNAVVIGYENVGDEKLFPNHTDKDIWMNGFYEGARWYREQLKQRQ